MKFDFSVRKETPTYEPILNTSLRHTLKHAQHIGSFMKKYLLFEFEDTILFIDQHAAHERINFEKFCLELKNDRVETQSLLSPITLSLSPQEKVYYDQNQQDLETLGFNTSLWDETQLQYILTLC